MIGIFGASPYKGYEQGVDKFQQVESQSGWGGNQKSMRKIDVSDLLKDASLKNMEGPRGKDILHRIEITIRPTSHSSSKTEKSIAVDELLNDYLSTEEMDQLHPKDQEKFKKALEAFTTGARGWKNLLGHPQKYFRAVGRIKQLEANISRFESRLPKFPRGNTWVSSESIADKMDRVLGATLKLRSTSKDALEKKVQAVKDERSQGAAQVAKSEVFKAVQDDNRDELEKLLTQALALDGSPSAQHHISAFGELREMELLSKS